MPPAARVTDSNAGCPCSPPTVIIAGSPNVLTNNLPQNRITDNHVPHVCGPSAHPLMTSSGSGTVFVNNLPAGRLGDASICSSIASGSGNVIIGG